MNNINKNTTFIRKSGLSIKVDEVEGVKCVKDNLDKGNVIWFHMKSGKTLCIPQLELDIFKKLEEYLLKYFNVTQINDLLDESE